MATKPATPEASAPAPVTTKAWTFTKRGAPAAVLHLDRNHPMPVFPPPTSVLKAAKSGPEEEWVLIKVSYAALNPGSLFYLRMAPACFRAATAVPEMDFSGVVEGVWSPPPSSSTSSSETKTTTTTATATPARRTFSKGDRIMGFLPVSFSWPTGTGALAGHIAVPSRLVVHCPRDRPLREAAGLILAAGVADEVLRAARVDRPGMRVLVNGASGGIGTCALQMARAVVGPGGHLVAVCSGRNADLVRSLGADEAIDYMQYKSLPAELRRRCGGGDGGEGDDSMKFDAVVDCVGVQALYVSCADYLKPSGAYGCVGIKLARWDYRHAIPAVWKMQANALWPRSRWLGGTGREWRCPTVMSLSVETMEKMAGMLEDGTVRTVIDSEWAFDEMLPAYEVLESGRAKGKIIIKVDDDAK